MTFALAARVTDRFAIVAVALLGLVFAVPGVALTASANPDGLFYEAQAAQLQGTSQDQAIAEAFSTPRAKALAASSPGTTGARLLDPTWERYSAQFYQRRWTVPAMAVVVTKATGVDNGRAVQWISMLGYALLGLALYGLLRRRFTPGVALATSVLALCAPPLYRWSYGQFVDSWGVVLEITGLMGLLLVADRGLRWLWVWIASMAVLSITRDATAILGISAVVLFLGQFRDVAARRRNAWLVGTGALAAFPALLLGGAPVRSNLAYIQEGYNVPIHDDWSHVISGYFPLLRYTLQKNFEYPSTLGILGPAFALFLIVCVICLVVALGRRAHGDAFWLMIRGSAIGCVVLLLIANNPQGYRLELVFAPVVAAGLARLLQLLELRVAQGVAGPERIVAPTAPVAT
jgi:hypothetical protein